MLSKRSILEPKRVVGVAVFAATILPFSSPNAFANHGDGGAPGPMLDPDNTAHDYDKNGLTAGGNLACDTGAAEANRSDLNTSLGNGDVHCFDEPYNAQDWFGLTQCTSTNWWNGRCDHYNVLFDLADAAQDDNIAWKYIGCHEFGHTGGLGHRDNANDSNQDSCMNQQTLGIIQFDQHDLNEINEDV